jgi:hypothetical protein
MVRLRSIIYIDDRLDLSYMGLEEIKTIYRTPSLVRRVECAESLQSAQSVHRIETLVRVALPVLFQDVIANAHWRLTPAPRVY